MKVKALIESVASLQNKNDVHEQTRTLEDFDPSRGSLKTTRAASKTIVQLEKWTRESLGTLQFHVEFVRAPVDRLRLPELVHTCLQSLR